MGKETKNLLLEVSAGIAVFTAAAMAAAFFIYPKGSVFAGLLLGMVLALVMFLSMALVLENSIGGGGGRAASPIARQMLDAYLLPPDPQLPPAPEKPSQPSEVAPNE